MNALFKTLLTVCLLFHFAGAIPAGSWGQTHSSQRPTTKSAQPPSPQATPFMDPNLLAGKDYLAQNNYTKAREALELALWLSILFFLLAFNSADSCHAQKQSTPSYAQPPAQAPSKSLSQLLQEAERLLGEGKYVDAVDRYEAVLKQTPSYHEAYFLLGVCYSQIGKTGPAETDLKKYLSFQTRSADGHAVLGILLQWMRLFLWEGF
jgi:Tfp pilus assembly protein PilF